MLLSFTVGNYLSFRDKQTLDLNADAALKEFPENLHIPYLYDYQARILKSISIYGHNSFGKSNFINAFAFIQTFVFNSFSIGQKQNYIDIEPFRLNTGMLSKPSHFEVIFLVRDIKFRYRCEMTSEKIILETLHYAEPKIRENYLFEREFQNIKVSKNWNKEFENKIENLIPFTKPHTLFLSVLLAQDVLPPRIDSVSKWFSSLLIIPDNYLTEIDRARGIYSDLTYRPLILKFIKNADLGFETIFDKIEKAAPKHLLLDKAIMNMWHDKAIADLELFTNHTRYDEANNPVDAIEFKLHKNESAGSIKYFIIVCLLSYAIKNSQLIWIDELDARFDSNLLEMLVKSFHDPDMNPINSQLIFTTHNTILLDKKLRRDQMVIVDKNVRGESHLSRMHSSKRPIRTGKSIEKEYRKGRLGGVSTKIKPDHSQLSFGFDDED